MKERIVSIQLMRALACLLVLIVHIDTFNPLTNNLFSGSIGVDIFFVISGYIIAASVERLVGPQPAKSFFINRFSRVIPYYYLITILFIAYSFLLFHALPSLRVVAKSLAFFPQTQDPVQPVGWTLNHEIFFYGFVGFSLLLTRKPKYIAALFLSFFMVLQFLPFHNYVLKQLGASINLEFFFGILIYVFRDTLLPRFQNLAWLGVAVLLLIVVMVSTIEWPVTEQFKVLMPAAAYYRDTVYFWHYPLTLPRGLAYGIPSAFLFMTVVAQEPRLTHFKDSNIVLRIGNASFTLYLIQHFFFILLIYFHVSNLLILVSVTLLVVFTSLYMAKIEGPIARGTKRLISLIG